LIHEYFHHLWPDEAEEVVTLSAAKLADFLHRQGARITETQNESLADLNAAIKSGVPKAPRK
jgi:hypothetical protein